MIKQPSRPAWLQNNGRGGIEDQCRALQMLITLQLPAPEHRHLTPALVSPVHPGPLNLFRRCGSRTVVFS